MWQHGQEHLSLVDLPEQHEHPPLPFFLRYKWMENIVTTKATTATIMRGSNHSILSGLNHIFLMSSNNIDGC